MYTIFQRTEISEPALFHPSDIIQKMQDFPEICVSTFSENIIQKFSSLDGVEKIAELYEIELSSFSDGIAVYTTDKDPQELMELGDNNGYPALTVNSNHYQLKKISEVTDTNQ